MMYSKIGAAVAVFVGGLALAPLARASNDDTPATHKQGTTASGSTTGEARPAAGERGNCPVGCIRAPTRAEIERARERRRARAEQLALQRANEEREREAAAEAARQREAQLAEAQSQAAADAARAAEAERQRQELAQRNSELTAQIEALRTPVVEPARGGGPVTPAYMPRMHIGIEGGGSGWAGHATNAINEGGTWGARIGLDFFRWLSIEGRYFGSANNLRDHSGVVSVVNGGSGVLVAGVPIGIARLYGFAGIGGYHFDQWFSTGAANSPLHVFNTAVVPMGAGLDFMIGHNFSLGAEGTFHYLVDHQNITNDVNSADGHMWTATGVLRVHL
jgi:hypothetical protein